MDQLFATLTHAVEAGSHWALLAALVWGVISIVLSPCHLASIPLIVGFINGQGPVTTKRAFALSSLFAVGILTTIAIMGIATAVAGRLLGDVGSWANYFVAVVFLVVGLHLLGVIPLPLSGPGQVKYGGRGLWAAWVLGLIFGIALGPCTFAYMAPILAVSLKVAGSRPVFSSLLLTCYGVGHCAVIVAAGTSTELVQRYINLQERSRFGGVLRAICGILVLMGGLYLIHTAR